MKKLACFLLSALLAMPLSAAWAQELPFSKSEIAEMRKAAGLLPQMESDVAAVAELLFSASDRATVMSAQEAEVYYFRAAEIWQLSVQKFKKDGEFLLLMESAQAVEGVEHFERMAEVLATFAQVLKISGQRARMLAEAIESTDVLIKELKDADGEKKLSLLRLAASSASAEWGIARTEWHLTLSESSSAELKAANEITDQAATDLAVAYLAAESAPGSQGLVKLAEEKAIAYFRAMAAEAQIVLEEFKASLPSTTWTIQ